MSEAIDWAEMVGDTRDLAFARRDLPALAHAVDLARGRGVCVQAGANVGIFPLYLAAHFDLVHCFEPSQDALDFFFENVPGRIFHERIVLHAAALGERPASGYLHARRRDGRPGHSGTYHVSLDAAGAGLGVPVKVETIDALSLIACGLIYLDIEGFELYALRGAVKTIMGCRPVIGVEINKNLDALSIKPSEVVEFIVSRGYRLAASIGSDKIFTPREWGE